MTTRHFPAKRRELDAEAANIQAAITRAVTTKSHRDLDALEKRVNRMAAHRAELSRQQNAIATGKFAALRAYGGDFGSHPAVVKNGRRTGREVAPLALPEPALKALYDAQESGQSIRVKAAFQPETKAFSTVDPLLPPQLQPGVVAQIHEWRLLDRHSRNSL